MRMRIGTRIIFSLVMLLIIGMCALVVLAFAGVFSMDDVDALYRGFSEGYGWIWAAAACVLAVVCFCLLFFGIGKKRPESIGISAGDDGEVVIVIDAFRELVQRYLDSKNMVITQKITVKPLADKTVKLGLQLSAKPDTDIPQAAAEIKNGLKEYLETYTGVFASNIDITIAPYRQQNT